MSFPLPCLRALRYCRMIMSTEHSFRVSFAVIDSLCYAGIRKAMSCSASREGGERVTASCCALLFCVRCWFGRDSGLLSAET